MFLNKINILFFIIIFCNYVYSQEVNEFKLNNIIVNSGSIEIEKKSNKIFLIMVFMLSLMILL
ncbi:MAG: putative phosphate ABC transporter, inner membrane subunit PstA [SAR86 cluster bacterium SAR86B]|uniref:Putative phosphate ABC transporter, inner membrane subunit PstA n=1 Tax=SAR86 cluster bacterium SAR86B TaxID=1123867 RepID=J4V448_9GAMM|nr:MAG: putative phosphate ABC transporter, inner membrane subunit PstA [SAR86 cluster bacterium SAR86B]